MKFWPWLVCITCLLTACDGDDNLSTRALDARIRSRVSALPARVGVYALNVPTG